MTAGPAPEASARPLWRGRVAAVLGVVLLALSLRMAVASLSPIIDNIAADFPMPPVIIGLIGAAPPVCYALFGVLTPGIERRLGLERLAVIAMAVLALSLAGRGLVGGAVALLLVTLAVFAALGVGNVLLPPLIKRYFPDRIGLMTTIYATTMSLSTAIPALVAVPVADAAGWRISLAEWSVFAAIAMIPWIVLAVRSRAARGDDIERARPAVLGRLRRLPLAWALAAIFAVSATIAYTCFAWLPAILVDIAGVTPAEAGALLSLFALMGLPASLLVPVLVARYNVVRALINLAVVFGVAGLLGLLFWPTLAPWLWVALLGLCPLLFPLALVLLGLRSRTHDGSVALSGFVQSVGYALAALFPLIVGLLHDLTGDWTAALWLLLGVAASAGIAGAIVARPHTVEDEWEQRHGAW